MELELNYDAQELTQIRGEVEFIRTLPAEVEESYVAEDQPPPPSVPHPSTVELLGDVTRPESSIRFPLKIGEVYPKMVDLAATLLNRQVRKVLDDLQREAAVVGSSEEFVELLKRHLSRVKRVVAESRKIAVQYCKKVEADSHFLNANKFSLYIRASAWREAVRGVIELTRRSNSWSVGRRSVMWRQLLKSNQMAWYLCHIKETFNPEEFC